MHNYYASLYVFRTSLVVIIVLIMVIILMCVAVMGGGTINEGLVRA
jgi:hypothetical protein